MLCIVSSFPMNQVVTDEVQQLQVAKLPVLVVAIYVVDVKFVIYRHI